MHPFYFVDPVTGAGKTRGAYWFAAANPTENFCFVVKSIELIDRTIDAIKQDKELNEKFPDVAKRIRYFHSGVGCQSVTSQITEYLKTMPHGMIAFVTHAAWQMLPDFHRKDRWHLIVDEVMQATYHETFTLVYEEHRPLLVDRLRVTVQDEKYSHVEARDGGEMRGLAHNPKRDQIAAFFKPLFAKLATSSDWDIVVETEQWQRFVAGKAEQIEFHGQFHACAFDGYIDVTFMAANFKETLTYQHFANMGCQFVPHKRIINELRYTTHTNGARVKVKCFTNRPWSKTLHKMKVMIDGEQMSAFECYRRAIKQEFAGQKYLWLANNGTDYDKALDGERLPNVPHGYNQFQDYHRCAILSALNPTPAHGEYLKDMVKVTARQIRRALLSETAYQAMGRGSIRKPDATEAYVIIVPDRMTADDIAKLYPGATISLLMGYDPVPPLKEKTGRPRIYESDADRLRHWRMKRNYLSTGAFVSPDRPAESSATVPPPCPPLIVAETGHTYSMFTSIEARKPAQVATELAKDITALLQAAYDEQDWRDLSKHRCGLITSAIFQADAPSKTNECVAGNGGIFFFDLDACNMPRDQVANLLPAQCIVCNSASSHTLMETRLATAYERLRLIIFANVKMTPDAYELVARQIADELNQKAAAQGYQLGLDRTKLHRGTMVFLPRWAESYLYDPCASFFHDHTEGRDPLDVASWLEAASQDLEPVIEPTPRASEAPRRRCLPQASRDASDSAALATHDPKYQPAVDRWHMRRSGTGNDEFNRLAWSLAGRGMAIGDIRHALKEEASLLNGQSKVDREKQIPYIIDHLMRKRLETADGGDGRLVLSSCVDLPETR